MVPPRSSVSLPSLPTPSVSHMDEDLPRIRSISRKRQPCTIADHWGGIASVGLVAAPRSPDGVVGGECANVPGNYPTTLLYSLGRRLDASWL